MPQYVNKLGRQTSEESLVGGKAASVTWLRQHRFGVPDGFVVNISAFHDFLAEFGIEILRKQRTWAERDLEYIREMLTACQIPDSITSEISAAYSGLGGRVAVRSSMVGEDTAAATFAGQLDTYLDIEDTDAVLDAVRKCWASAFNWRLATYLQERNTNLADELLKGFSVAVLVQQMVEAQAAGVAFSADPITGQRCVLIEAVQGLGEKLVQGIAEPDRYTVDSRGVLCSCAPLEPASPILSEERILELAQIVQSVAGIAGTPVDIEWAWDGTAFFLLQSRPITSLAGRHIYSRSMIANMIPGTIKPLVWSTSAEIKLQYVFGRIFGELIGPNDVDPNFLAKRIHSRVYMDNTYMGSLLEKMGFPPNFFEVMTNNAQAESHPRPPINLRTIRTMLRTARFAWRHSRMHGEIERYIRRHHRELDKYRDRNWSSVEASTLLSHAHDLEQLHRETMWYNFVGPMNMMIRNRLLHTLTTRWVPNVSAADLVSGLVGRKSLDSNLKLQHIAEAARDLGPEACTALLERPCSEIEEMLSASEQGRPLLAQVRAFLDHYGFLSAVGTDLSRTPWAEDPTVVWRAIGRTALRPQQTAERTDHQRLRDQARERARSSMGPLHRWIFDRLLESIITYMDLREQSSLLVSEESFHLRRVVLALGDVLVSQQTIDHREDIFYLLLSELYQLASGHLEASAVRDMVAKRRADIERDALLDPPETICGEDTPVRKIVEMASQPLLVGIGGSAGWAEGYARVVLDPATAPPRLGERDILIIPFSDVSWTPLFAGIGGVVAETGGQLSHSAIIAREYGLPAVVNVKNATRLIQDGQQVAVDGNSGQVHLM